MSLQSWQETRIAAQVDGAQLVSSTAATSLLPGHAKVQLEPQFFSVVGKAIRVSLRGRLSNVNPTPGTLTLDFRLGSIGVATSPAFALNTTAAKTNVTFWAELLATCRAVGNGTSANLMFQWRVESEAFALATTGVGALFGPASAPAVGSGFDSTAQQTVDLNGQFSVSSASNNITIHQFVLEALN